MVYTFQRAADEENAFTGNTAGFVLDALGYVDARVDGELEATIIMEKFSHIALGLISEVYIHCKDSYEAMTLEEAAANPIGSGPYMFVEWIKDDSTCWRSGTTLPCATPASTSSNGGSSPKLQPAPQS